MTCQKVKIPPAHSHTQSILFLSHYTLLNRLNTEFAGNKLWMAEKLNRAARGAYTKDAESQKLCRSSVHTQLKNECRTMFSRRMATTSHRFWQTDSYRRSNQCAIFGAAHRPFNQQRRRRSRTAVAFGINWHPLSRSPAPPAHKHTKRSTLTAIYSQIKSKRWVVHENFNVDSGGFLIILLCFLILLIFVHYIVICLFRQRKTQLPRIHSLHSTHIHTKATALESNSCGIFRVVFVRLSILQPVANANAMCLGAHQTVVVVVDDPASSASTKQQQAWLENRLDELLVYNYYLYLAQNHLLFV